MVFGFEDNSTNLIGHKMVELVAIVAAHMMPLASVTLCMTRLLHSGTRAFMAFYPVPLVLATTRPGTRPGARAGTFLVGTSHG